MTAEDIQRLAMIVLDRAGATRPPVDIDAVAANEGLSFHLSPYATISGAYLRLDDFSGVATIATNQSRARQRFTKAHELAHHLMDAPQERRVAGYEFLRLPTGYRGSGRHWAHEFFAGCLLMPRAWIGAFIRERGWQLQRLALIDAIAWRFEVSRSAAEVRLRELAHIP